MGNHLIFILDAASLSESAASYCHTVANSLQGRELYLSRCDVHALPEDARNRISYARFDNAWLTESAHMNHRMALLSPGESAEV